MPSLVTASKNVQLLVILIASMSSDLLDLSANIIPTKFEMR